MLRRSQLYFICLVIKAETRRLIAKPKMAALSPVLSCSNSFFTLRSKQSISNFHQFHKKNHQAPFFNNKSWPLTKDPLILYKNMNTQFICLAARRKSAVDGADVSSDEENYDSVRKLLRVILWVCEGVYILWLFLLPYAPGDPVWAISKNTVESLIGLSLNFLFILPFLNSVGIHVMEAPVLHPVSEGLFNFVIGWTLLFAPLLFTDRKRDRFKGSLDVLWGLQIFLTNTFLIPYMAIRLNEVDSELAPRKQSQLGTVMTNGAPVVGLIGGSVCLISVFWAVYGRMEGDFGDITERWGFFMSYIGSDRVAYAFIWDICFYIVFQAWLIGDNLHNVKKNNVDAVRYLRFVPVVGLVAYLLFLNVDEQQ